MKHILLPGMLFLLTLTLFAQNSVLRVQAVTYQSAKANPVINQQLFNHTPVKRDTKPGEVAQRHALSLLVLGPLKMVLGTISIGLCVNSALTGKQSGLFTVVSGVLGGFHLISGAALIGGGVFLLKKAKRQREQNYSKVYLSMPDVKVNSAMGHNAIPALGLHTAITF